MDVQQFRLINRIFPYLHHPKIDYFISNISSHMAAITMTTKTGKFDYENFP